MKQNNTLPHSADFFTREAQKITALLVLLIVTIAVPEQITALPPPMPDGREPP